MGIKVYLSIAVIVLMLITSAGIFGYLSNAYQGATLDFETQSTKLNVYQDQVEQLQIDKQFLVDEMTAEINAMPDNYATAKRKARAAFMEKINPLSDRIYELTTMVSNLKIGLVSSGVDVGPVIFIARSFETSVDTVVKFFILILIFVFDPLAVMLVVATNMVLLDHAQKLFAELPKDKKSWWDKFKHKKKESMYGPDDIVTIPNPEKVKESQGQIDNYLKKDDPVKKKKENLTSDEFRNKVGIKP